MKYLRNLRILSQLLFVFLFVFLMLNLSVSEENFIPVNFFLRLDFLLTLCTAISCHWVPLTMLVSLVIVMATIILGRFFCGWMCPMGTILDGIHKITRPKKSIGQKAKKVKYLILLALITSCFAEVQMAWFFDPLIILTRTFAISIFPLFQLCLKFIFSKFSSFDLLQEPVFKLDSAFKSLNLIPENISINKWSWLILAIFTFIIILEIFSERFWCKILCPLGAVLSLLSFKQILKITVETSCNKCGICTGSCKMEAMDNLNPSKIQSNECIICLNCVSACQNSAVKLSFHSPQKTQVPEIDRRKALVSCASGLVSAIGIIAGTKIIKKYGTLIRPPGAVEEEKFLDLCIRCHECIRACSTSGNFLQPSFLESGIEGIWTPIGTARNGWCEYECNLCTLVCPTGAIRHLSMEEKKKEKIAVAWIDKTRCWSWKEGKECLVCQEHCPTSPKAIFIKKK